jgi:hypothetical protein
MIFPHCIKSKSERKLLNAYSVKAKKSGEIGCFQVMNDLHKFGAVNGITCSEHTTGEETELK